MLLSYTPASARNSFWLYTSLGEVVRVVEKSKYDNITFGGNFSVTISGELDSFT